MALCSASFSSPCGFSEHPVKVAPSLSTNSIVCCFVLASLLLVVFITSATGQGTTGLPPFSTIHASVYDDVKINDGAVLLTLPVWSKPGLIPFSYSLVFNNAVGLNALLDASIPNVWSAQTSVGFTPALQYSATGKQVNCPSNQQTTFKQTNFKVIDGYGASHPIPSMVWDSTGCFNQVLSGTSSDGSGFSLTITPTLASTIHDGNGNVFNGATGYPNTLTDPNGNQLSYAGSGFRGTYACGGTETLTTTYTDTTGLVPMTETVTCVNSAVTTDTHSWTDISGNPQSFTINYSQYTQKTNFGCYLPGDIGPFTTQLPSSMVTPAGNYTITYESQSAGTVTGRIAKIVFPSGASAAYAYTGGSNNNGLTCEAQTSNSVPWYALMVPVLKRTLTDVMGNVRIWKYDTTQATNETVVTDPSGNDSVYLFYTFSDPTNVTRDLHETQRQIYQGSHTSGQLLKTVLTCYNGNTTNCANPSTLGGLIAQKDVYTTLAGMTQSSQSETKYDGSGNLLEDKEYDFTGTLISDRVLTYGTCSSIGNRVCSDTTNDGSGHVMAQTNNTYDAHGNRTQTSSLVSGTTYLTSSATYNPNGTVEYSYDTNLNKTTYTYGACNGAMLTLVQEPMNLTRSMTWNCTGGVPLTSTDENSQITPYKYETQNVADPFWRLKEVDYPDSGQATVAYHDTASPPNIVESHLITSSLSATTQTNFDGFGNATQSELTSDPQGATYAVKVYDPLERLGTVYNPTRCNPPTTNCGTENTWGYATTHYDALNRVTSVVEQDGSTISMTYTGNCTTVTDEALHLRKSCIDGIGRLTSVWEDPSGLDYETDYQYDALNNLTGVTQKGSNVNNARTRTFQYDALSRLTSATNPESGTITYSYVKPGGALCSGNPSLVCTKTAPSPNQLPTGTATVTTTYSYDALNRLTGKTYTDTDTQNPSTPAVAYGYDGVSLTGCTKAPPILTDTYPLGRRTSMCDGSGATSWHHDPMGRVLQDDRFIGSVTPGKFVNYGYTLDGYVQFVTTPPLKTIGYTYNAADRVTQAIDSTDGINFVTSATYAPPGELQSFTNGGAIYGALAYNSRLQPTQLFYGTNTPPLITSMTTTCPSTVGNVMNKTYGFSFGTNDNGNVLSITNCRDTTRTQSFTYDSLNRIASGQSSGTQWGEMFTIDAWGNLTNETGITGKTNHEGLNTSVGTNNQLAGFGYDAAGNMTSNGSTSYVYDAENRLVWTSGYRYLYDGDGKRVEKCVAATSTTACPTSGTNGTLYWKGMGSDTLDESDLSGNALEEYAFFGGQRVARRDVSTNNVHYYFSDHLGSHSVVENATGTACEQDIDYYPYGGVENNYCPNVAQNYKFTGKERDTESSLDNFGARYYASSMGRFMSIDPAFESEILELPQTWNRYSYVYNRPLFATDPDGRCPPCVGAIIGGVVEGGWNLGSQLYNNGGSLGDVNWRDVGANALGGAVTGAIAGATGGTSLLAEAAVGAGANAAGGIVTRIAEGEGPDEAFDTGDIASDAVSGFVGGAAGHLASEVVHPPEGELGSRPKGRRHAAKYDAELKRRNRAALRTLGIGAAALPPAAHLTQSGIGAAWGWITGFFQSSSEPEAKVTVTVTNCVTDENGKRSCTTQ